MANYVFIENNIIKEYYDLLPKNWRHISGFNLIKDEEYLKSLGWYKVINNNIDYDPSYKKIINYEYIFENDKVYQNPLFEDIVLVQNTPVTPSQISATQLRLWLVRNNIPLSAIENALDSVEDNLLREELKIMWEYVPYFERKNEFINNIGDVLGLSQEQIDAAFMEASRYL